MSGLNDFLKGIGAFSQGLSQFAQSEALRDANEQLNQINQAAMDDKEREQALNNLSQTFANRLGQAGASAATIQSTTARMGMSEPQQRNLDLQREALDQRQELAILGAQSRIMASRQDRLGKQDELTSDTMIKAQKEFESLKDVSTAKGAIGEADTAIAVLEAGNPIGDQAIGTMMARASGEVGTMTDRDIARFSGSPELVQKVKDTLSLWTTGKRSKVNREDLMLLAKVMKGRAQERLSSRAVEFATGRGRATGRIGVEAEELLSVIAPSVIEDRQRIKAALSQLKETKPGDPRIKQLQDLLDQKRTKK